MTGFVAPTALPTGAGAGGWVVSEYRRVRITTEPAVGGAALGVSDQLDTAELWLVDRAVVSCSSPSETKLRLYEGVDATGELLSGSDRGNFDEAEYPTGLLVESGRQVAAVWTQASNGARGKVTLQVRVLRPAS